MSSKFPESLSRAAPSKLRLGGGVWGTGGERTAMLPRAGLLSQPGACLF